MLRHNVREGEEEAMQEYVETREATDVAATPPSISQRLNVKFKLTRDHMWDICKLNPLFEKRKDYDADIQQYAPDLCFNNFAWSKAKRNILRMTQKFLDENQSFIAVCNDKVDEKLYFQGFTELFALQQSLGLKAFGGYSRKLDHGVKVVYLLQPEWWDYLDYLRR